MTGAALLLVDVAAILTLANLLAGVARRFGQPPVIGEVIAGIMFGPTFLGSWSTVLFPSSTRPVLAGLADIGIVLFMFGLGLEFGREVGKDESRRAAVVAAGSTGLPFAAGVLLALGPADTGHHSDGGKLGFVLFMGTAMSVTAVPVLARMLRDARLTDTTIGRLALSSAVICDVLAWSLLALATAAAGNSAPSRLVALVPFMASLVFVARPALSILHRWAATHPRHGMIAVAVTLGCALVSAAGTQTIGLHLIFGAFLLGIVSPRSATEAVDRDLRDYANRASQLLLPVYFTVAGLQLDLRFDVSAFGLLLLIIVTAAGGKLLGSYAAARVLRIPGASAAALAILLNTRGLTELVVLTTGLQLGILDQRLYSVMVCMALVTTMATGPLLRRVWKAPVASQHSVDPVDGF
ncbi:cation:proton antiporter [Mycobacterium riyadhense]|uniref:Glutathione-regulated potassium-efflux system protein KefC n=1 Tax=Mycobacterium riyadhense TaxID=486698 RepID=A0A653F0U9_9MYCO|nr:cation:proton antiporter [Mycobacterium riyadhense]VTP03220.1 Glutathione-regulated potassium-efflux system protein KefC [Mycobacterium riyadhense]